MRNACVKQGTAGRREEGRGRGGSGWRALRRTGVAIVFLAGPAGGARAGEVIPNAKCLECHADKDLTSTNAAGKVKLLYLDAARLSASVHRTNLCASCHADLTVRHPDDEVAARPVNCAGCHAKQSEVYAASIHGVSRAMGASAAASCADCHSTHDMLSSKDPRSPVFKMNLPRTCARCHDNAGLNHEYRLKYPSVESQYQESIHGRALMEMEIGRATSE